MTGIDRTFRRRRAAAALAAAAVVVVVSGCGGGDDGEGLVGPDQPGRSVPGGFVPDTTTTTGVVSSTEPEPEPEPDPVAPVDPTGPVTPGGTGGSVPGDFGMSEEEWAEGHWVNRAPEPRPDGSYDPVAAAEFFEAHRGGLSFRQYWTTLWVYTEGRPSRNALYAYMAYRSDLDPVVATAAVDRARAAVTAEVTAVGIDAFPEWFGPYTDPPRRAFQVAHMGAGAATMDDGSGRVVVLVSCQWVNRDGSPKGGERLMEVELDPTTSPMGVWMISTVFE